MKPITQTRAPLLCLLFALIFGLLLARALSAPITLLVSIACIGALSTFYLALVKYRQGPWILCFLISSILCFWAYGLIRIPATPPPSNLELPPREAQLSIRIQQVMQPGDLFGKASGIAQILSASTTSRMQTGDLIFFAIQQTEGAALKIERGLQVQTTGVLTPIQSPTPDTEGNDFEAYLKSIGVHYRFDRTAELQLIQAPSAFKQFCTAMNERFQSTLRLGSPDGSQLPNVYVAMLLGRKIELTKAQKERYQMTGTMHFFAISGLHVGVIATVIAQFLLLIRVPRNLSPCIGLPILYLYVEITGAAPSAVRAFLMAAFFWSSFAFKRQRTPFSALICSAVLVLIIAPQQLWSLGFQLSYAVVVSILLFGLPLHERLTQSFSPYRWLPEEDWSRRQSVMAWALDKGFLLFAISFSAWLASAPLSAGLFEMIAPGAILLNMLLVYLVAITISAGIISLAFGMIALTGLSGFINHSAWTVIYIMDQMVIVCSELPGAILASEGFPTTLSYAALSTYFGILLWLHHHPERLLTHRMWLPPGVIVCAIATGLLLI